MASSLKKMLLLRHSIVHRISSTLRRLPLILFQKLRVWKYSFFSDAKHVTSLARFNQPVLMIGRGKIRLGQCYLGVWPSPYYLNGYIHIEARNPESEIMIGNGVWINNNAVIIAEQCRIEVGDDTLIGPEFMVIDSDFHDLDPVKRLTGNPRYSSVSIGKNVFIGARVTILKGVTIGDNSVVAAGSVVQKDIPQNVIAGGVPAIIMKKM
jgi:maltose O-acetyltransferase